MKKTTKNQKFIDELYRLENELGCEAVSPEELKKVKKSKLSKLPK